MLSAEIVKISEVSEFSILKTRKFGKCAFTSNFDNFCNLIFRNDKNELRQKLFPVSKIEISKILESFLSLQTFTVVVTCSIFLFSRERVKPCFFVTFNTNHVFPENFIEVPQVVQKIWRFSNWILTPQFFKFSDISLLKEINDVSI